MSNQHPSDFNREAYNRWAAQYDHEPNSTIAMDDREFPKLWEQLTGKRILEIGAGTGRHTRRLAGSNNRVTAIELSPEMLQIARHKVSGAPVEFILGDFLVYDGFGIRQFDVVVTSLVLEHIKDVRLFFERVAARLEGGGHFFLSEIHPSRIAGGSQAHFVDQQTGQDVYLASFAHPEAELLDAAAAAGLTLIQNIDVVGDAELAARRAEWQRHVGKPMIKMFEFVK